MTEPESGKGFEETLERLESILRRLEEEELRLDEALRLFEEGVGHLRHANELLQQVTGRVEELLAVGQGEAEVVPFDGAAEETPEATDA